MIFVTLFVSLSFSQVVTNQSTVNSSIINGNKKNDSSVTVINAVGDIDCSNHLDDQVEKDNPDILIILGDLCYKSNLKVFNATYGHFKEGNKLACLIGNHDSKEDGSSKLLNNTREYCRDHWYRKIANDTTLLIG
jgi:predicted phosphodiesterase